MVEAPHDVVPRFWPLFAVALGVRFGIVLLGALLAKLPPDPFEKSWTPRQFRAEILGGSARVIEPWYRFDAEWYVNVSRNGYAEAEDAGGRLGVAFLPALPAAIAVAGWLGINIFWTGILLPCLAGAAGAAVFARFATKLTGDRATGLRAFVLLNAFPTAFFFSAPYNESFGLLFTALTLDAWLDGKSLRAGLFALFGSLARMTGVAIGVAAIAAWLCDDRSRQGAKRALLVAAGSFGGLALFWLYLGWAVGDPFAGLKSQTAWGRRELSLWNPWHAIESIYDPELPRWNETCFVLLFAILGIRAWVRKGAFWGAMILVPIAQMMMSGTFMSGHRLILAALPGFIELAELLRNRWLFRLTVVGFAVGQWVLVFRYTHWIWAG